MWQWEHGLLNSQLASGSKSGRKYGQPPSSFYEHFFKKCGHRQSPLFLKVSDVLFDLLLTELKQQDAIKNVVKFNKFDISKHTHLERLE